MNDLRFYHGTGRTLFVTITNGGQPVVLSPDVAFTIAKGNKRAFTFTKESLSVDGNRLRVDISHWQTAFLYGTNWELTISDGGETYPVGTLISDGFITKAQSKDKFITSVAVDIEET